MRFDNNATPTLNFRMLATMLGGNDILLCTLANTYKHANKHTIVGRLFVIASTSCLFAYRVQTITIRLFVIVH